MIGAVHTVMNDVPPENVLAMMDAVEEFGRYPLQFQVFFPGQYRQKGPGSFHPPPLSPHGATLISINIPGTATAVHSRKKFV